MSNKSFDQLWDETKREGRLTSPTIEQLSRAVAEKMEPEPTWKWGDTIPNTPPRSQWWYYDVGKECWHPFPIDRAEVSMRLLKDVLRRGRVISALGISDAAREGSFVHHRLENIEDAIAQAWLKG